MATQYTSILKLALPVQGELSGTWGTAVNEQVTSMVEEAIAGLKTINTWVGNSATLSTADGATSESRAAILNLTDTTSDLSGAATLLCPAASKVYIVKNATGQAVTVKPDGASGIAVPNGTTAFLFCDGTNVVEAINNVTGNLTVGGNASIGGNLTVTGNATISGSTLTADTAFVPDTADGATLGTSALEFSDLFLADGGIINFGNDQDITLTHAADTSLSLGGAGSTTGLIINNTATDGDPFLSFALSGTQTFTMGIDDGDSDKFKIGTTAIGTNTRLSIDSSGNIDVAGDLTAGGSFIIGSASIAEAELEMIDGITAGTVAASKAMVVDANKDIGTIRNLTIDGTFSDGNYTFDTSGNVSGLGTVASGAITSSGIITGTGFTAGNAVLAEAELEMLDGITAGTVAASKAMVVDSNKDIGTIRNLTIDGTFSDGNYTFDTSGNVSGLGTVASGAITSSGIVTGTGFTAGSAVLTEAELEKLDGITNGTVAASKAMVVDANKDIGTIRNLTIDGTFSDGNYTFDTSGNVSGLGTVASGAITSSGSITSGGSFIIGSASIAEAELEMIDGITAGTVAASKAMVVDSNKDIGTIRNLTIDGTFSDGNYTFDTSGNVSGLGTVASGAITSTGNITSGGSFIIGSASIAEAELEMIDGITAGTVAASKAMVVDSNKDIGTIRNLTIDGTFSDGNYTFDTSGNVSGLGTVASGAITSSGVAIATTFEPSGDTSSGDNAAIGYTSTEGLILTGQGSTNDVTIKNDADADVIEIPTGTTNVTMAGNLTVAGDFTVSGTTTTVTSTTVAIADSMLKLAKDQGTSADDVDFGFYGKYGVGGTAKFAGIFRDQSVSGDPFTFFDSLQVEPGTTVNTGGSGYDLADIAVGGATFADAIAVTGVATVGGITIGSAVIAEAELEMIDGITAGTVAASKAVVVDSNKDVGTIRNLTIDGTFSDGNYTFDTSGNVSGLGTVASGAITSSGVVTATGFTIGSAVIAESELEQIDGITAGTVAASKAVVVDANKDVGTIRNLTIDGTFSDGNYTFDTSGNVSGLGTVASGAITSSGIVTGTGFTAGNAVLTEAELEKLDGITNGTVAASKAVVVDSNKDIGTFRNITINGTFSDGNYTFDTSGNVSGLGTVASGAITSSGNITSGGSFIIGSASIAEAELEMIDGITAGTVAASKAVVVDSNKDIGTFRNITINGTFSDGNYTFDTSGNVSGLGTVASGAITSSGNVTSGGSFIIGSASIAEAELEMLDGITAGTVAASKAVVVDSNKDIGTFRNITINGTFSDGNYTFDTSGNVSGLGTVASGAITSSGNVTSGGSFIIGSASIAEAELEMIDGITAGTVAASKAVVVDSNKDVGTIRNLTIDGTFSDGNYTFDTSGNVSGLGTVASGAITTSGVLDITNTTDSSDATGDTGALRVEGGASIAKKLFVGTDADIDGILEADAITVNGTALNTVIANEATALAIALG